MFHPDTQFLIDHWTGLSRRGGVRAGIPDRASLEPDALGLRLPRAFIAERHGDDAVIRLAGSWIERTLPMHIVRRVAAALFLVFGAVAIVTSFL